MITCIYDYISENKCIKCMILMHEIACYQKSRAWSSGTQKKEVWGRRELVED